MPDAPEGLVVDEAKLKKTLRWLKTAGHNNPTATDAMEYQQFLRRLNNPDDDEE